MKAEIVSIEKKNMWKLILPLKDTKPIRLRWLYKIQRNTNGSIRRYKACLFAPVALLETIRLLVALEARNGWKIHHSDVKATFLYVELKEECTFSN